MTSRLITRYPNRRLYDRTTSRHITAEGVQQALRDGDTVTINSLAGEDMTCAALISVIKTLHDHGKASVTVRELCKIITRPMKASKITERSPGK